ncbi:MAG: PfkB family carbohydrate kinase [Sediminibacterium sp.]|nr:PfkB family carbohydrate kinase [Sediminibacterium sp.]
MNTVLCIGEALVDMICTDSEKSLFQGVHFIKKCGRSSTSIAIALTAIGGKVINIACVGDDPFGEFIFNTLKEFKVNTDYIFIDKKSYTTMAYVSLKKDNTKDLYFQRGADGNIRIRDIQKIDLNTVAIFYFGSVTAFLEGDLFFTYLYLLKYTKEHKKFIYFDPSYRALLFKDNTDYFIKNCNEFLAHAHLIKMTLDEALLISKQTNINDALTYFATFVKGNMIILLDNKDEILYYSPHNKSQQIISNKQLIGIDSTGSCDNFVATLLYHISLLPSEDLLHISIDQLMHFTFKDDVINTNICTYFPTSFN